MMSLRFSVLHIAPDGWAPHNAPRLADMLAALPVAVHTRPNGPLEGIAPAAYAAFIRIQRAAKFFGPGPVAVALPVEWPPGHWMHGAGSTHPTFFNPRPGIEAYTLVDLLPLLQAAADDGAILVQGVQVADLAAKTVRRKNEVFADVASSILPLDLDKVHAPDGMDPTSLDAVRWLIRGKLPPEFHTAACIVQWSSSAGLSGQAIKCHLFFALSSPRTAAVKNRWAKGINTASRAAGGGDIIDPAVLQQVQPIYVAAPRFAVPAEDPFAHRPRWVLLPGDPTVPAELLNTPVPSVATFEDLAHADAHATLKVRTSGASLRADSYTNALALFMEGHTHTTTTQAALWGLLAGHTPTKVQADLQRGFTAAVGAGMRLDAASFAADCARVPADMAALTAKGFGLTRIDKRARELKVLWAKDLPPADVANVAWSLFLASYRNNPFTDRATYAADAPVWRGKPPPRAVLAGIAREWAREDARRAAGRRGFAAERRVIQVASLADIPHHTTGVIAVRAPMGAGKTENLGKRIVAAADGACVHVSPRIALVADSARRLGLPHYKGDGPPAPGADGQPAAPLRAGLATCLPSLDNAGFHVVENAPAVIFDEWSSCLDLLAAGEVVGKKGPSLLARITQLLTDTARRAVWLMDAQLGEAELAHVERFGVPRDAITIYELDDSRSLAGVTIHGATLEEAERDVAATIADGGRVLLLTDSISLTNTLVLKHPEWCPRLVFTSKNRGTEQDKFAADPNGQIERWALVMATSVIDTGISITNPCVDLLVMVAHGVIDAESVAQMLGRYRPLAGCRVLLVNHKQLPKADDAAADYIAAWRVAFGMGDQWTGDPYSKFFAHRREDASRRLRGIDTLHLLTARGATKGQPPGDEPSPEWSRDHRRANSRAREVSDELVLICNDIEDNDPRGEARALRYLTDPCSIARRTSYACRTALGLTRADLRLEHIEWYRKYGSKAVRTLLGGALPAELARGVLEDTPRVAALKTAIPQRVEVVRAALGALLRARGKTQMSELTGWDAAARDGANRAVAALGAEKLRVVGIAWPGAGADDETQADFMRGLCDRALRLIGVTGTYQREKRVAAWDINARVALGILARAPTMTSPFDIVDVGPPIGSAAWVAAVGAEGVARELSRSGMRADMASVVAAMLVAGAGTLDLGAGRLAAAGVAWQNIARFRVTARAACPPWVRER